MSEKQITKQELQAINEVLAEMADDSHKKFDRAIAAVAGLILVEIGCAIGILKLLGVL